MKASTDRILTMHTGSLPRPDDLTGPLAALDTATMPDAAAFDARVRQAVIEIVRAQRDAGVDAVSDGDASVTRAMSTPRPRPSMPTARCSSVGSRASRSRGR